jgi:hypothetical protein
MLRCRRGAALVLVLAMGLAAAGPTSGAAGVSSGAAGVSSAQKACGSLRLVAIGDSISKGAVPSKVRPAGGGGP